MKKLSKKLISCILAVIMLFTSLPVSSFAGLDLSEPTEATTTAEEHAFGDGLTWSFDESTGELSIKGEGAMPDFVTEDADLQEDFLRTVMSVYPKGSIDLYDYFGVSKDEPTDEEVIQALSEFLEDEESPLGEIMPNAQVASLQGLFGSESSSFSNADEENAAVEVTEPSSENTSEEVTEPSTENTAEDVTEVVTEPAEDKTSEDGVPFAGFISRVKAVKDSVNITVPGDEPSMSTTQEPVTEPEENITLADIIPWYEYIPQIKSVVVGEGVTTIGSAAFVGAIYLEKVSLPSTMKTIGTAAFWCCFKLKSVDIPEGVTDIGTYAFAYCMSAENVSFPSTLKSIGEAAFFPFCKIKDIDLPEGVEVIGDHAFGYMLMAETISFPSTFNGTEEPVSDATFNLKEVYNDSEAFSLFENCSEMYSLSEFAFDFFNNQNLLMLFVDLLADKVSDTLDDQFYYDILSKMMSVTIDESKISEFETEINNITNDFSNVVAICKENSAEHEAVKKYGIKHKLIGSEEFHDCFDFRGNVTDTLTWRIDEQNKTLIFEGTGAIPDYSYSSKAPWSYLKNRFDKIDFTNAQVTEIGDSAFENCSGLTNVEIPNGVISIGSSAFEYCSGLTSITIPDSVADIGDYAFSGCSKLECINVDENNAEYASISGSLFKKDYSRLIFVPAKASELTIPAQTVYIGTYNEYDSSVLTDRTLSLFSVDENNTRFCEENGILYNKDKTILYKGIVLAEEVEISSNTKTIYSDAFKYSKIKSVVIPNGVTSIGFAAFNGCSSLTSVTIPNSVTNIDS